MNTTHRHQGYLGSIEVDIERNILHGKILFIQDLVTYEAATAANLQRAFMDAVDEYIQDCADIGKDPDKPFSGSFNVRMSPELHRECALLSTKAGISLNEYVAQAIRDKVSATRMALLDVNRQFEKLPTPMKIMHIATTRTSSGIGEHPSENLVSFRHNRTVDLHNISGLGEAETDEAINTGHQKTYCLWLSKSVDREKIAQVN